MLYAAFSGKSDLHKHALSYQRINKFALQLYYKPTKNRSSTTCIRSNFAQNVKAEYFFHVEITFILHSLMFLVGSSSSTFNSPKHVQFTRQTRSIIVIRQEQPDRDRAVATGGIYTPQISLP